MTYDEMFHDLQLEMHRLQRENKTLGHRNKELSDELRMVRARNEAITGFGVMKM